MKKQAFLLVTILSLLFVSCSSTDKKSENTADNGVSEVVERIRNSDEVISEPIHLTVQDFKQLVMNYEENDSEWVYLADKPAIIDFWAEWCAPCRMIAPILDELAEEYAGQIYVFKVDVESERELGSVFGIQSIPTLFFVPQEGEPRAERGAQAKEHMKERIDQFLLSKI